MNTISGIYKITNTITGDFYIGSSNNVNKRWADHKYPSTWKKCPNNPMYLDMQKYGVDKFAFEILAEAEVDKLKKTEQEFIEMFKPSYNNRNANGLDVENRKKYQKEYKKSDKYKETKKEYQKKYRKSEKAKESHRKSSNKYNNQLCFYNDEILTLHALSSRFKSKGIPHPVIEAKKYLIQR